MKRVRIIHNGEVIARSFKPDEHAAALWAHLMGWNVDSYDDRGGRLSSDCGMKHATLRIFGSDDDA